MADFDKIAAEILSGKKCISKSITFSNIEFPDGRTIEKAVIDQDTPEAEMKTAREFLALNAQNSQIANTNVWGGKLQKSELQKKNMLKRVMGSDTPISSIDRSTNNNLNPKLKNMKNNYNQL